MELCRSRKQDGAVAVHMTKADSKCTCPAVCAPRGHHLQGPALQHALAMGYWHETPPHSACSSMRRTAMHLMPPRGTRQSGSNQKIGS